MASIEKAVLAKMMAPLRERYLKNLSSSCDDLTGMLGRLRDGHMSPALVENLTLLAHSLAGSGGTYGFPEVSKRALALEDSLNPEVVDRDEVINKLQELTEACGRLLNRPLKVSLQEFANLQPEQPPPTATILVVDDNPDIRQLFATLLGSSAKIVSARSASEAFAVMAKSRPDLMLLDDMMPGTSGTAMLKELRFNPAFRDIPVIMVTANRNAEAISRMLGSNVLDLIIKPFQPQQAAERIKEHLNRLRTSVLIVDDDSNTRALLLSVFAAAGVHARVAENGAEALALMQQAPPDGVLLDYMMPGMNGAAVLEAMKEDPALADIPVIFLTAKNDVDNVLRVLKLGAVDYIVKPVSPEEVLKRCLHLPKRAKARAGMAANLPPILPSS